MLQFIAEENDRYSIAEQAQMAIEGGCKWVQLRVPSLDDAEIRELAAEIIPLCKETSTILVMEDHVELVKELAIHGVHITPAAGMTAAAAREYLGPEAIVGVEVGIASAVEALRGADIDYAAFTPDMPVGRISENVEALRSASNPTPLVASGSYPVSEIPALMATGVNGLALSSTIGAAADPVETTERILGMLGR